MNSGIEQKGYNCVYCGQFVADGENHICNQTYMWIPESVEVQILRQILTELQIIERLLREKL